MNVTLAPSESILMNWEQYVSGNFNRASIPWNRYRYSKNGVIEVSGEARQNADIAGDLFSRFKVEIRRNCSQSKRGWHVLQLQ
ncbi:MAG: hypothetical protein AAGD25_41140 [Cyanobacteria bacterium P01_F01_bin.150]